MRKVLFVFCILGLLLSCSSDDSKINSSLIGTWRISEINNDPGYGSGVFRKIKSDKTLVFKHDNEITSNGSLCENTTVSDSPSSGTFEINENSTTSGTIRPSGCNPGLSNPMLSIHFEIKESILFVYYPCIEGCAAKYVKQ
ncbi:lipocalin family protein [Dysgonomonas sp. Marseille-P4677]|uniref:lipocalin family protein n=1 Tax=Dysgonomonas sp. Marseille-P4677 TaxID=2364790 RepID=UPI0019144DDE|nr:lipocalin family protein [Dysgonomonas sp. Marseille-P4677]MBK5723155.1 lipocalin family protein [Dysgonomonas sp. Marseille-P4677]